MSGDTIEQSLEHLSRVSANYNGFNLLFSDGARLAVYESVLGMGRELGPGMYGLSNHLLDTPWPKVQTAKSRLSRALSESATSAAMLELLRQFELE
jgi:uncharacterized protein with NRDE domain